MADEMRKYTIPLRKCYKRTRVFRAKRAINDVRAFISKHMKVDLKNVVLEESINVAIWAKGGKKVIPKITVETEKTKEGKAIAWVAGKRKIVAASKDIKKTEKKEDKKEKPVKKESEKAEAKEKKEETKGEKEEKVAKEAPKKGEQQIIREKIKPVKHTQQALQSKGR